MNTELTKLLKQCTDTFDFVDKNVVRLTSVNFSHGIAHIRAAALGCQDLVKRFRDDKPFDVLKRCEDIFAFMDETASKMTSGNVAHGVNSLKMSAYKGKNIIMEFINKHTVTCGFIVHSDDFILACHATGHEYGERHYDIPKGCNEDGETYLQTAIRELREETGIVLGDPATYRITDLGVFPYRKDKDICLFHLYLRDFDRNTELRCDSMFTDADGMSKPEMNGYAWVKSTEFFYPSLQKVFRKLSGPIF